MEPQEIREEVKEKLEHAAENWISYLALTTVLLAVCATLSSFQLEHNSVESVLKQALAVGPVGFLPVEKRQGVSVRSPKREAGIRDEPRLRTASRRNLWTDIKKPSRHTAPR